MASHGVAPVRRDWVLSCAGPSSATVQGPPSIGLGLVEYMLRSMWEWTIICKAIPPSAPVDNSAQTLLIFLSLPQQLRVHSPSQVTMDADKMKTESYVTSTPGDDSSLEHSRHEDDNIDPSTLR